MYAYVYRPQVYNAAYGYVYEDIKRGMYGLPQAVLFAQQLLEKLLNKKVYH